MHSTTSCKFVWWTWSLPKKDKIVECLIMVNSKRHPCNTSKHWVHKHANMLYIKVFKANLLGVSINGNGSANKGRLGRPVSVRLTLVAIQSLSFNDSTCVGIRTVTVTHIIWSARSLPLMFAISLYCGLRLLKCIFDVCETNYCDSFIGYFTNVIAFDAKAELKFTYDTQWQKTSCYGKLIISAM